MLSCSFNQVFLLKQFQFVILSMKTLGIKLMSYCLCFLCIVGSREYTANDVQKLFNKKYSKYNFATSHKTS